MSVLLKGLAMPRDGERLKVWIVANGQVIVDKRTYYEEYEAVELPEHGDLIDRDALMIRLGMAMDCEDCPNRTALYFCGLLREMTEVCDELESAPVVIQAERSEK